MNKQFESAMLQAYETKEPVIYLGSPIHESEIYSKVKVGIPLSVVNRHGLIAGATGTGKTKSLQNIAEQLSRNGVSVFLSDIKGDLSGLAQGGVINDKIKDRCAQLDVEYKPEGCPVDFLTISGLAGVPLRATIESFGPVLMGKILDANDNQQGMLTIAFKYAKDNKIPLVDINDLRNLLTHISTTAKAEVTTTYGQVSAPSIGVLQRNILQLQEQGGDIFCGEPAFDVNDLLRVNSDGKGIISILSLSNIQDKPLIFSTFMLWMLNELYKKLPEVGDLNKPKLVFFFDEAHYLFDNATDTFRDQIEQVARLIRSKGVGIYFITQTPRDVPTTVLGQLGNRIQHALRAFTPEDEKAITSTAKTFAKNDFYDIKTTLTNMGIGEALVTILSSKGIPTPTVHTLMAPPNTLMGPASEQTVAAAISVSAIHNKYINEINRESATEILQKEKAAKAGENEEPATRKSSSRSKKEEDNTIADALNSPMARAVGRELVKGGFSLLKSFLKGGGRR